MTTKTRQSLAAFIISLSLFTTAQAQEIQQPARQSKTSFAIVVDQLTYKNAKKEIDAYRESIENSGLGTYIIAHNWNNPDEIRNLLKELYGKKQKLEGTVLIGDIPVPMIRDAQHLTSTFKMNQKLNWKRSSVPSDRFYDDFHLAFDFLKQDTAQKNYFYYSINPAGPQQLKMDIYSGRIKPPLVKGKDKYQLIREYLSKVVAEKKAQNKIDNAFISTGHGYTSESQDAWAGEQLAFKNQFPQFSRTGTKLKTFTHLNSPFLKFNLLSTLKDEQLDIAIMHNHGYADMQLLNGYQDVSDPNRSIENITRYLRSKLRSAKEDGRDVQKVKDGFIKRLGVSNVWMDNAFDPKSIEADSIFNHNLDIHINDILETKPNARFVMLDNCLTGSYHLDEYMAGYYPFSAGKNIVTIANSIGVLQDLWSNQLLGILQHGSRVGNWFKHTAYLETHIMGDPTFNFTAETDFDVNQAITGNHDTAYWKNILKKPDADLQALALIHLGKTVKTPEYLKILKETYFNSAYESTRTQAFLLLRNLNDASFKEIIFAAVNDPHEYIRRMAISEISENGSDEYIPVLINSVVEDFHSERIATRIRSAIPFMNAEATLKAIQTQITPEKMLQFEQTRAELNRLANNGGRAVKEIIDTLNDQSKTDKARLSDITTMRAYRYHETIPTLITFVKEKSNSQALRLSALEALSWFPKSYRKDEILKLCKEIVQEEQYPAELKKQATKNINIFS